VVWCDWSGLSKGRFLNGTSPQRGKTWQALFASLSGLGSLTLPLPQIVFLARVDGIGSLAKHARRQRDGLP